MNRKCPICESEDKEILYVINFCFNENDPLPNKNEIVVCKRCGFAFADNNATQNDYDDYYYKSNDYTYCTTIKYRENNKYKAFFPLIEKYIHKDAHIIDVGCGDGSLLNTLKMHGYDYLFGLDPSQESINKIKNNYIEGIVGSLFNVEQLNITEGSYDVVLSFAVAEHIYDLDKYVENLNLLTKTTGIIFVAVPAVESFGEALYSLPNYFNCEHINYFSETSLDNLFGKVGCQQILRKSERLVTAMNGEKILCGIYRHSDSSWGHSIKMCTVSKTNIVQLLAKQSIEEQIQYLKDFVGTTKFIVWGTGSLAHSLLSYDVDIAKRVSYCIDNNPSKQGRKICGIPICAPDVLGKSGRNYPVVICSMQNADEIAAQIEVMKIPNKYYIYGR